MATSDPTIVSSPSERVVAGGRVEAPVVLTDSPPRPLRFFDQFAMWANLGISLFGPLTGALIVATTGSVGTAIAAIVLGCGIGAALLGVSAVLGASTGMPAMVSLRGLLGRRASVVPTVLNIGQNIGWATMEIIVISTAATAIVGDAWRWLAAGGSGWGRAACCAATGRRSSARHGPPRWRQAPMARARARRVRRRRQGRAGRNWLGRRAAGSSGAWSVGQGCDGST